MIKIIALLVFAILAELFGSLSMARGESVPRRIVSFNLCADQLLVALADPSQIAGLSPYATNGTLSVVTEEASRAPRLDWDAESVVNLAPDLVFVGPSHRPTQMLLAATGLRVVEVGLISTLESARQQAREVGVLVGHSDRGEALAQALEQAEVKLKAAASSSLRTALVVARGGYSEGPNALVTAMLMAAGFRPPAEAPAAFGGFVSLEQLLLNGPDVLVLQDPPHDAQDQGALFMTHPALLAHYGPKRRIDLPARYTLCGGPALLRGLEYLTVLLRTLG